MIFRYQNELPKKIKSRGKDAHMVHEELVQTMRWKQIRGKFYPQLLYLIKVNTPRAVMQETKKAFRKLPNLEQAITALSNLKGVGITMASGKEKKFFLRLFFVIFVCSSFGSCMSRNGPIYGRRVPNGNPRYRRNRLHHQGVPEICELHPSGGR